MSVFSKMSRIVPIIVGATLLASALPAGQALAAKPANTGSSSGATLSVSPNPVAAHSTYHISGCGYTVGVGVELVMGSPTATSATGAMPDASGCINRDWNSNTPGSYTLQAFQDVRNRSVLMASTSFTVQ